MLELSDIVAYALVDFRASINHVTTLGDTLNILLTTMTPSDRATTFETSTSSDSNRHCFLVMTSIVQNNENHCIVFSLWLTLYRTMRIIVSWSCIAGNQLRWKLGRFTKSITWFEILSIWCNIKLRVWSWGSWSIIRLYISTTVIPFKPSDGGDHSRSNHPANSAIECSLLLHQ